MPYNVEEMNCGRRPPLPGRPISQRFKIAVDKTLTKANEAAEAQATGKAIETVARDLPEIKTRIDKVETNVEEIQEVTIPEIDTRIDRVEENVSNLDSHIAIDDGIVDITSNTEENLPIALSMSSADAYASIRVIDEESGSDLPIRFGNLEGPIYNDEAANKEYVDTALADKMDKANPAGTGSFSLNRKSGSTVGNNSCTIGNNNEATGGNAFAEGYNNKANANNSHVEGQNNNCTGDSSHIEGVGNTATGSRTHVEGGGNSATGNNAHAEGYNNIVSGGNGHTEGQDNAVNGTNSHGEGQGTIANGNWQHVAGRFNVADNTSARITGGGTSTSARKNIEQLTFTGDLKLKGDVYAGCNDDSTGGNKLATEAYVDVRIPTPPSTADIYTLQCVVTASGVTYQWVGGGGTEIYPITYVKGTVSEYRYVFGDSVIPANGEATFVAICPSGDIWAYVDGATIVSTMYITFGDDLEGDSLAGYIYRIKDPTGPVTVTVDNQA